MGTNDLLENLKLQRDNLEKFQAILQEKQRALVNFNYELLEQSTRKEERMLGSIQQTERIRLSIIKGLNAEFSIVDNPVKIINFVNSAKGRINGEYLKELIFQEKAIKELLPEIGKISQQNKYLIETSKAFIRETVNSLMNAKRSILDRRI
ncbi:MAG: flagellar export chaperone FlgN [Ignavibacteria bacterium]